MWDLIINTPVQVLCIPQQTWQINFAFPYNWMLPQFVITENCFRSYMIWRSKSHQLWISWITEEDFQICSDIVMKLKIQPEVYHRLLAQPLVGVFCTCCFCLTQGCQEPVLLCCPLKLVSNNLKVPFYWQEATVKAIACAWQNVI